MAVTVTAQNNSSRSNTPSSGINMNNSPKLLRKISSNTLEQYSPLTEDNRRLSLSSAIEKTKEGLGNLFGVDEQSPEDLIYNLFKVPNKSDAFIGKLIMVLKNHGLQENDPRLAPMMRKIREIESEKEERTHEARDPKHWKLSKNDFKRVISESMSLIVQTMQGDLIVPAWGQFTNFIREIYEECIQIEVGRVADYIPQLARMLPENWGVSICTVDGQRASFGNSKTPFCVQSVSKAFNYSIAASELGAEFVHQYVGQEPSGRLFNEICLDSNNKPHNPMVNSGAIIVTSLIQNRLNMADRFEHMINQYRKIAGGEYVGFNNAMFLSEANTADRNFALAYFMKENGCFPPETSSLKDALDFYFQLCSLEVTSEGLSVMAATLANGGVCPLTGERCIGSRPCRDVLSMMNSCGMYDYSGQFAFHVGLPAKSGVSGVMIVVVPNLMGIALWSPPLDKMGNSVRGVEFCKKLVQRFNFHNYDSLVHNESPKFDPRHRIGERERAAVVSLLFAAKAGDLNTIRRMYMQQVDLEMADYDKRTALHLAASEGHFDVALFLLEIGKVKADPRDRWNRTPLDDAREARHTSVALLLERRVQELEQAKTIPAGRPLTAATKASSLQLLPSQQRNPPGGGGAIMTQSSSGGNLMKEAMRNGGGGGGEGLPTAQQPIGNGGEHPHQNGHSGMMPSADGEIGSELSIDCGSNSEGQKEEEAGGTEKRRQVPPSPLSQRSFSAAIGSSPPAAGQQQQRMMLDSGLSGSIQSPDNDGQEEDADDQEKQRKMPNEMDEIGDARGNGQNGHRRSVDSKGQIHSNVGSDGPNGGHQYGEMPKLPIGCSHPDESAVGKSQHWANKRGHRKKEKEGRNEREEEEEYSMLNDHRGPLTPYHPNSMFQLGGGSPPDESIVSSFYGHSAMLMPNDDEEAEEEGEEAMGNHLNHHHQHHRTPHSNPHHRHRQQQPQGRRRHSQQEAAANDEFHGRTYSNGMRYWTEEKERIEEEANGRHGIGEGDQRQKGNEEEEEEGREQNSTDESDEEEEEDILSKRDHLAIGANGHGHGHSSHSNGHQIGRNAGPSSTIHHGMPADYFGRLSNHRIQQLRQHHYI